MSFLRPAASDMGMGNPNAAAMGAGRLFGWDPSRVSSIAGRIGAGANSVATMGGADPGYQAPQVPNNFMQFMNNPELLQTLMKFRGGGNEGISRGIPQGIY